jgi:hypothetical protein
MHSITGLLGAEVLRREANGEVAFVTLTRFETLDAIQTFAGEEYETPVCWSRLPATCFRVTSHSLSTSRLPLSDSDRTALSTRTPAVRVRQASGGRGDRPAPRGK